MFALKLLNIFILIYFVYVLVAAGKNYYVLSKIADNKHCSVCMHCWDRYQYPLADCVILTKDYNPSNCKSHLKSRHPPEDTPALFSDVSTITNSSITNSKAITKQSSMSFFQNNITATPQVALSYLYSFFNDANVAIHQTSNVNLTKFINYLLDNATQLQKRKEECYFSKYKYTTQRDDRYLTFVSTLKEVISYSREYYHNKLNKYIPFLCVSHDGWDSLEHDVLGVSLHFIVPTFWKVVNVAVGLKRVRSKKSIDTSNVILIILKR